MDVLQIQGQATDHKHGHPEGYNAVWICSRPGVCGECEWSVKYTLLKRIEHFSKTVWGQRTLFSINLTFLYWPHAAPSSPLGGSCWRERGRSSDLHHCGQEDLLWRSISSLDHVMTSVLSPTAAEGHPDPPHFNPDPGGPSPEPETSFGQDLRLLPAQ